MNTERDEQNKRRTTFKKPNQAGWVVICLLVVLSGAQFAMHWSDEKTKQAAADKAADQRFRDSVNIATLLWQAKQDSASFAMQRRILESSYLKQIDVLTNTNSIIGQTNELNAAMSSNFARANVEFSRLLHHSESLLNPLLPMVARFRLRIPFSNPWMAGYLDRILPMRDSLVNAKLLADVPGIDNVSLDFAKYYRGGYSPDSVVYGFSVDTSSVFFINDQADGVSRRFLNPGYYIYLFENEPPPYHFDTPNLLALEASSVTEYPGPGNPFGSQRLYLNFRDSYAVLDVYYRIENHPGRGRVFGVNDLGGKYMLISSQMPNLQYKIESIVMFTGPSFANYIEVPFDEMHNVSSRQNRFGNSSSTLVYLRKLDSNLQVVD